MLKQDLGNRVKQLRVNRNISQNELAVKLGLHRPSVSEIERGNRDITPDELLKLAQIFSIRTDDLLNFSASTDNSKIQKPLTITFYRHPEAVDDVYNQFGGWSDPELTPKGLALAYHNSKLLNVLDYEIVYSSPLNRARQMAEVFAMELKVDLKISQYLKEKNSYGLLSGLNKDIAKQKYPELVSAYDKGEYVLASERHDDFEARVELFFKRVESEKARDILAITHGKVLSQIIKGKLGLTVKNVDDCGNIVMRLEDGGYYLVSSSGITFSK